MTSLNERAVTWIGHEAFDPLPREAVPAHRFDLSNLDTLLVREVPLDSLHPGLYLRKRGTSEAHVQLLAEAATGAELPPILVQEDGWRVIDGLHRLAAARLRGDTEIRARFLDCADSEALVLAIKANGTHGLPLSRAERVAGAQQVLAEYPEWSDRAIAGMTALSAKTIASLRSRTTAEPPGTKRLGRDGRRRPVAKGEGRRRAAAYLQSHPGASMRQVARETDVSLGTVHDVCARLRRGDDPGHVGPHRPPAGPQHGHRPLTTAMSLHRQAGARTPLNDLSEVRPTAPALRGSVPRAWEDVCDMVANDPTVRYTDGGRKFVRWMAMHAMTPDAWREFIDSIPPHWIGMIAPIAESMATEWGQFAQRLQQPLR